MSHLRLLSVIPDVTIPEDVLPADERLDPALLAAEGDERFSYILPAELLVGREYGDALFKETEGSTPPPAGVVALFAE
jgi:hypothetical protein